MLLPDGYELDPQIIPVLHWQSGLFGRGTQNLVLRNSLAAALKEPKNNAQLPPIPGFELAAHYHTSARAGGDYYDFFPLHGGGWGVFIADVSGHGTPAAVLMAITHAVAHPPWWRSRPGSQVVRAPRSTSVRTPRGCDPAAR